MSTTTRTLHVEDARAALSDAVADLLHVLVAERRIEQTTDEEILARYLSVEFANSLPSAFANWRGELTRDGFGEPPEITGVEREEHHR